MKKSTGGGGDSDPRGAVMVQWKKREQWKMEKENQKNKQDLFSAFFLSYYLTSPLCLRLNILILYSWNSVQMFTRRRAENLFQER